MDRPRATDVGIWLGALACAAHLPYLFWAISLSPYPGPNPIPIVFALPATLFLAISLFFLWRGHGQMRDVYVGVTIIALVPMWLWSEYELSWNLGLAVSGMQLVIAAMRIASMVLLFDPASTRWFAETRISRGRVHERSAATDCAVWYYLQGGVHGPISEAELLAAVRLGEMDLDTPVWSAPMSQWARADTAVPLLTNRSERQHVAPAEVVGG